MERRREPKMNERLKLESVDRAASVRFWVWAEGVERGASAHFRSLGMAIRAPKTGHSLSAIFAVSPSPKGHLGKSNREQILGNGVPWKALAVIAPATVSLCVPFREEAQALKRHHKDHVRHAVGVG